MHIRVIVQMPFVWSAFVEDLHRIQCVVYIWDYPRALICGTLFSKKAAFMHMFFSIETNASDPFRRIFF